MNTWNIFAQLNRIEAKIDSLRKEMYMDFTALSKQVQTTIDVETSAKTLLDGLAAQLQQIKNDPAAVQAFVDKLQQSSSALAADIVANTPAAP